MDYQDSNMTPPVNQEYPKPNNQLPPSNNLVIAIITTILCCLPLGIVAIVYASKVNGLWMSGNYQAAYQAAKSARNWSIASAIVAAVIWIIYLICIFAFGATLLSFSN